MTTEEHINQEEKDKAIKLALVEKIKADYLTGKYTTADLSVKYNTTRGFVFYYIRSGKWRDIMEQSGIPIPRETKPDFTQKPNEVWDQVESDYMKGVPLNVIAKSRGVNRVLIVRRAEKFKWAHYREQLEEARKRSANIVTLSNRMSEFDEMSATFLEAAKEQLKRMAAEIEINRFDVKPERLQKLIEMHNDLYQSVKKIPVSKSIPKKNEDDDIHPALKPAKIVKIL